MRLRRGLIVPSLTIPQLSADFEGASPLAVFDSQSATPPTVEAAAGREGNGARFDPNLSTRFLRWRTTGSPASIPTGQAFWSVRLWLRYPGALPNTSPNPSIFSVVQLTGLDDFTFFYNIAQNRFQWDLDQADLGRSLETLEADRFYLIEAKGSYATNIWTADVRIDGIPQDSIATAGNGPSSIDFCQFGISAATQVWTGHFDDCALAFGTSPLRYIGS